MVAEYRLEPVGHAQVSMDPALQRLLAEAPQGPSYVVARIDPEKLNPPASFDELAPGQALRGADDWQMTLIAKIGRSTTPSDGYIVTAKVEADQRKAIRQPGHKDRNPWLLSLKLAPGSRPQLHATKTLAWGDMLSQPDADEVIQGTPTGKGVIIGVVDYGCDFASPAFRIPGSGETRLLALWDQNAPEPRTGGNGRLPGTSPPGFGYGTAYSRDEIIKVLRESDYTWGRAVDDFWRERFQTGHNFPLNSVYGRLGYDPARNPFNSLYREPPRFYSAHTDVSAGFDDANQGATAQNGARGSEREDPDPYDAVALHGTHVADIAAGSKFTRPVRLDGTSDKIGRHHGGIAPGADLVFVQVRKTDWKGEAEFTASSHILDGVRFILDQADRSAWIGTGPRPVVINLSLNAYTGPHDGRTLLEMGLDAMANARKNTAIVISAANNQRNIREHRALKLGGGQTARLDWRLGQLDSSNRKERAGSVHEVEIWYPEEVPAPAHNPLPRFTIGFRSQDGVEHRLSQAGGSGDAGCEIGQAYKIQQVETGEEPKDIGEVYSRYGDPNNGKGTINLILREAVAEREWFIEFDQADSELTLHAWIEYNQENQSSFVGGSGSDDNVTLGSICGTERCVVVGSHACTPPNWWNLLSPSEFTSRGPVLPVADAGRDAGRLKKPDLVAPGEGSCRRSFGAAKRNLVAAAGRCGGGPVLMQGTSQAAPHVAGAIALLLQRVAENNQSLSSEEIIDWLHESCARRVEDYEPWNPAGRDWDPRLGYGLLNVAALLALAEERFRSTPVESRSDDDA